MNPALPLTLNPYRYPSPPLPYPTLPYPILSYPILSYPILSYPILRSPPPPLPCPNPPQSLTNQPTLPYPTQYPTLPNLRLGRHIVFGADPVGVGLASFTRYLLNRWMDFDQTCTDTLLGGRNKLIRFW